MPRTSSRSYDARLAALEAAEVEKDSAIVVAAAEFDRRLLRLVDRLQGQDPAPGASLAETIAADLWHLPGALAALRASAPPRLARDGWDALKEEL